MVTDSGNAKLLRKIAELENEVSELRHAGQKLRAEDTFVREVLYWIDSLVVVIDLNGFIVNFNRASEKLSGYRFKEIQDKPFWDTLLIPEEKESIKSVIKDVTHEELPNNSTNFWITKDGKKCLIKWSNSVLRKTDGSIEYILCTGLDITERAKAEESRRKSEIKYKELVQNANSIIIRLDTQGCFTFFNEFAEKFLGWSADEILGQNVHGTILPDTDADGHNLTFLLPKIIKNPECYETNENENILRNGDRAWVAWTNKAICNKEGEITEILCIGNDITEQKRLEVQLRHAQKMEALGLLAGGVAHDLNNILTGIVSYPDLLLLTIPADSPLRKSISRIKESGEKAAAVVQDLLTLARRGVAIDKIVNMNDIIYDLLKSPEYDLLKKIHIGADFGFTPASDLLNIMGSPTHLSKTVMNLISNAAEALLDLGTVTITTENCYIDSPVKGYEDVQEGDYVLLSITDTGTGISPDDLSRIFEPFFTKKQMGRSGTGLGMAVVWGTVKDHNGYIDVQSDLDVGTKCDIYFPVTRHARNNKAASVKIAECRGSESILIIDDIEEQREIASEILVNLGYSVASAASGEEAVAYMRKNSTDLLILDMIMEPGIDGLETYTRILEYHPGQKAIVASGFAETDRVNKALALGAGTYIKKPYVLETIGFAVRSELDKQP
jgi:PAS domain S-box-containing protein